MAQTKPRILNMASVPPNPLRQVPPNSLKWLTEQYAAWYERLRITRARRSERRVQFIQMSANIWT
jgi:hypothetical protein